MAGAGLGGRGANGIGRPVTQRLLASGERVLDVPAKLAARARVFDTGQGRKTDAADAHAIVMVALRDKGLREVTADPELMVLRMLRRPRRAVPRPQPGPQPAAPAVPGPAARRGAGEQVCPPVPGPAGHRPPRDLAGKTRRRMAAEELEDVHRLDAKLKAMKPNSKPRSRPPDQT